MTGGTHIELDARIGLALLIGLPRPKRERTYEEWQAYGAVVRAELDRLRQRAQAGEFIAVDRAELARAVAEFAEVNDPRREETVDVLVELVLAVQCSGVIGSRIGYYFGELWDIGGWPTGPITDLEAHLIAATDLGLFDAEDQPRRERVDPDADWQLPPDVVLIRSPETAIEPVLTRYTGTGAVDSAAPSPPPSDAPGSQDSLRDRFLREWEGLLDRIVDRIVDGLIEDGYITVDHS